MSWDLHGVVVKLASGVALLAAASLGEAALLGRAYNPATGHWYELYNAGQGSGRDQIDYENLAQGIDPGAHLVTINNAAENQWLHTTPFGAGGYTGSSATPWIGFYQPNPGVNENGVPGQGGMPLGGWEWYSDPGNTLALTYTNWGGAEPNGGATENNGQFRSDGGWNDLAPTNTQNGLIELPDGFTRPGVVGELLPRSADGFRGKAHAWDASVPSASPPDWYRLEYLKSFPGGSLVPGLRGSYFDNASLPYPWPAHPVNWGLFTPVAERLDANVDFSHPLGLWAGLVSNFSVVWRGKIYVPADGTYRFHGDSDDRSWLAIDGVMANGYGSWGDNDDPNGQWHIGAEWLLTEGYHDFEFRMHEFGGGDTSHLSWQKPGDPGFTIIPAANFYNDFAFTGWITLDESNNTQVGGLGGPGLFGRYGLPDGTYQTRLSTFFNDHLVVVEMDVQIMPEPATMLLLGGGLLALARRRTGRSRGRSMGV